VEAIVDGHADYDLAIFTVGVVRFESDFDPRASADSRADPRFDVREQSLSFPLLLPLSFSFPLLFSCSLSLSFPFPFSLPSSQRDVIVFLRDLSLLWSLRRINRDDDDTIQRLAAARIVIQIQVHDRRGRTRC
jgi:hypothetical protein